MIRFNFTRFTVTLSLMAMMSIGAVKAQKSYTLWLNQIDLQKVSQDWSTPRANQSVDRKPLTIGGVVYKKGIGTHAVGLIAMELKGTAERFQGLVGFDDEVKGKMGSVVFVVQTDKKEVFRSPLMKAGMAAVKVDIDLKGVKRLSLIVEDGGDGIDSDHSDWVDAFILYNGTKPLAIGAPAVEPYIDRKSVV